MKLSTGLALSLYLPSLGREKLATPDQTEGPYYPPEPSETDADLTRLSGSSARALGEEIVITGLVRDLGGKPLPRTKVELWQACASGRYLHPGDPSTEVWDPNFQGFGRVLTDKQGHFRFRTIKPGAYPISRSWMRPPHIHFKFECPGYPSLTTQMYFEGDELNRKDSILMSLTPAQRRLVLVNFQKRSDIRQGHFEVVLSRDGKHSGLLSPALS